MPVSEPWQVTWNLLVIGLQCFLSSWGRQERLWSSNVMSWHSQLRSWSNRHMWDKGNVDQNFTRQINTIILCIVYHPPRCPSGQVLLEYLIAKIEVLRNKCFGGKFLLRMDLNKLDINEMMNHLWHTQIVNFSSHQRNTLDLIMTDLIDWNPPSPHSFLTMNCSNYISVLWVSHATIGKKSI